jgi:hypothetical protein
MEVEMNITATQINEWANTIEARGALPRVIRKLVNTLSPIQSSFPAGDSTNLSSWDGELFTEQGNAWVPVGKSYWEFSCEKQIFSKASSDYIKRAKETSQNERLNSIFIFVTAHRWSQKAKWVKAKKDSGEWGNVRAYDGDDLEQWLEQCPAIMLEFSEDLGLTGPGVESLKRYWEGWA